MHENTCTRRKNFSLQYDTSNLFLKSPNLAAIDITQAVTLIQSRATTFYINVEFQSSMDLVMRLGMWTVDFNLGEDLLVDLSP